MIDAKHIEQHLDEEKPEGAENEAVEQVAFADRLLINKIDLVSSDDLTRVESRLRELNKFAPISHCQNAAVALEAVLGIRGFELDRVLEMDPEFLDTDGEHVHDNTVTSVGFNQLGELDLDKTNSWIGKLLQLKGADIFRMKGVLAMSGSPQRFVYQGVHMQFQGEFTSDWGDAPRVNKLIFIGKNLNREQLIKGFQACANTLTYIKEDEKDTTKFRFGIGDKVLCLTKSGGGEEPDEWSAGVVSIVCHREPQFPPGHYVPYQVRLARGGAVFVPDDDEELIRADTSNASAGA